MKFTLSWLKDHLETSATLDEIVEMLTMIGLEVEAVDDRAEFSPFVIAKVLSAEPHPNADRLKVLSVDPGDGKPVQVVCGAPNARAGLIGAFAAPGTYVPGINVTLAVTAIRGVESCGMMCSERELEMSQEHDGIIDLADDAPVGGNFAEYTGLADPVLQIGITPNRPDALGVAGIARDLAAAGLGKVKPVMIAKPNDTFASPLDVRLEFGDTEPLCSAFGLRYVRGVTNCQSPKWMQQRLRAIGLRPISALVDITNYVTFDLGRPLHVFDADKVAGNLAVRRAADGEKVLALDGKTYELTPQMCVIADDNGVESLAGIMGGEVSGCSDDTVNVLVESALWEPLNIARTGRDLGILSDARYRFERGVDPAFMAPGLDHAANLVVKLCGGEISKPVIAGSVPVPKLAINFPISEIARLTGISIPDHEAVSILQRLGFTVTGTTGTVDVVVPTWRPDVHGKADLVEEVMRIYGVNNIVSEPLPAAGAVGAKVLTTGQVRDRAARRALATRGMLEAVTWTFIAKHQAKAFGGGARVLELDNPISSDMSDMRPSLLPGLLAAAQRNADQANVDVALFEVAPTFAGDEPGDQRRVAGGIRQATCGPNGGGRHWRANATVVDVYDAKADALTVLEACGVDISKLQINQQAPDWYHPGRSGTINLGPKLVLGHFGELHPLTLEQINVAGPATGFEIFLDTIPEPRSKAARTRQPLMLSPLQAVHRDFAFVVGREVDAATLLRAARGADKKRIRDVSVFDVFEGAALGADRKSVALEVTIQPLDKTLTDEEIEAISSAVISSVEKSTGGVLRR